MEPAWYYCVALEKLRGWIFWCLGSQLPGSTKLLQMSAENSTHLQAGGAAEALECQALTAGGFHRAGASCSLQASQNRAAVPLTQFSGQDQRDFFWTAELQIPLLAQLLWVGGEGRKKSCSGNKAPTGVCRCGWWEQLTCQTHRSLLHPAELSWEIGQGLIAWYMEKAHLECLVSPTNPQLSN